MIHFVQETESSVAGGDRFRILIMKTVEGQTSTEVGKHLGLSSGQVRVSRHRTAQKLRQFVAAQPALADAFGISPPLPNASGQSPHEFSRSDYPFKPLQRFAHQTPTRMWRLKLAMRCSRAPCWLPDTPGVATKPPME